MDNPLPRYQILNLAKGQVIDSYAIQDWPKAVDEWAGAPPGLAMPKGVGGSGVVYVAKQQLFTDISIDRAMKFFVFRPDVAKGRHSVANQISATNFEDEVANIAALNHENVMKVVSAGAFSPGGGGDAIPYLVTELIDGEDLRDAFSKGVLRERTKQDALTPLDLCRQLLSGLRYLHQLGFYHFDIAPKNIFLEGGSSRLRVVIGDLGVGRTFPARRDAEVLVLGSRDYCLPEAVPKLNTRMRLADISQLQPAWDVFAASKTLLEVIGACSNDAREHATWISALVERLGQAEANPEAHTAASLLEFVNWVDPVQRTVAQVPELAANYPGNRSILIPVAEVHTSKRIRTIADHPAVMRLKHVPQLAMASAVFPGAEHTRYEHSLGTYEVMRRYMIALLDTPSFLNMYRPCDIELALVASLVSSITRFPFSAVVDEVRNLSHDRFSECNRESIYRELLLVCDANKQSFKYVLEDRFPLLPFDQLEGLVVGKSGWPGTPSYATTHFLLNSSIDCRVIDFLQRDSVHIGMSEGHSFQFEELLRQLTWADNSLVLRTSGLSVVEQIISLRYWMFSRVYWNRPNRAFLCMLKHVLLRCCEVVDGFEARWRQKILVVGQKEMLQFLHSECNQSGLVAESDMVLSLLADRPEPFGEVLQYSRGEGDAKAVRVCTRLAGLGYSEWFDLHRQIEDAVRPILGKAHDGSSTVLVDYVKEDGLVKLGDDLTVLTVRGQTEQLRKVSGIVDGALNGFGQHLQRVRVFAHPSVVRGPHLKAIEQAVRSILET